MKAVRRRDRESAPASAGGPDDLIGSWVNTHTQPQGLSRLDLLLEDSGLALRLWGPDGRELETWEPETKLYCGISAPEIIAFSSRCDLGGYEGLLQGNLNLGLLVLGGYKTFPKGGGYFSREFFARRHMAVEPADNSGPALFANVEEPVVVSPESMVGRWRNTDAKSPGIAEIVIEDRGGRLIVEAHGSSDSPPIPWGKTEAGVYGTIDELGAKTFSVLASYDLDFMVSDLQIRLPGGALAIADFSSFTDSSGRSGYFTREFYYRV